MVGCIPPWSAERWRPWSHAFQSASAPSCPGDFWWERKGSGEATGSDSNRNFPFQIQWKLRIWMKTMRTSMVFEYCHPLKKHHFPARISIRMKKHTIVFTVFVCIFLFGKINVYYQLPTLLKTCIWTARTKAVTNLILNTWFALNTYFLWNSTTTSHSLTDIFNTHAPLLFLKNRFYEIKQLLPTFDSEKSQLQYNI